MVGTERRRHNGVYVLFGDVNCDARNNLSWEQ